MPANRIATMAQSGGDEKRARGEMGKRVQAKCADCYFRRAGLCALPGDNPCPTFRHATAGVLGRPDSHASSPFRLLHPDSPRHRLTAMRSRRDEFDQSWQPRLWIRVGLLILIGAYLIAFIVGNDEDASVNFVLGEARTSLIRVILLSLLAGLVGGVLLSQLHRRRQARSSDASVETPSEISEGDAKLNASRADVEPPAPSG